MEIPVILIWIIGPTVLFAIAALTMGLFGSNKMPVDGKVTTPCKPIPTLPSMGRKIDPSGWSTN